LTAATGLTATTGEATAATGEATAATGEATAATGKATAAGLATTTGEATAATRKAAATGHHTATFAAWHDATGTASWATRAARISRTASWAAGATRISGATRPGLFLLSGQQLVQVNFDDDVVGGCDTECEANGNNGCQKAPHAQALRLNGAH
jgi:hypothetical protein